MQRYPREGVGRLRKQKISNKGKAVIIAVCVALLAVSAGVAVWVFRDDGGASGPLPSDGSTPSGQEEHIPGTVPDANIIVDQVDSQLVCDSIASFTGVFVEDGSDTPVENVVSILVTNRSDRFLDMGELVYDVEGQSARFVVTGLPPGKSAWVMESSGMVFDPDRSMLLQDTSASFREDAVSYTEDISFYFDGTMLIAVNDTDAVLENVSVCYKTLHTDGNYLGGITYMVTYDVLEPDVPAEAMAGHYTQDSTHIVRVSWQEPHSDDGG